MLTTIWRRHLAACPHKAKGRAHLKCSCPLWGDGYLDGKRVFRQSLGTRDLARARKKAVELETADRRPTKSVRDAAGAFLMHCTSQGHAPSTARKYRNTLNHLEAYCKTEKISTMRELTTDAMDAFRAGRGIKAITSSKELELLRQFCGFCVDRHWADENVARKIKAPRNLRPNEIVPFTQSEVQKILAACDLIGRNAYERTRSRAMVLALRYTALRIGDVAMLSRDRISRDGDRWRIFLRTEKSGKPVFLPIPTDLKHALDTLPLPKGGPADCPYFFWSGQSSPKSVKSMVDRTLHAVFTKSEVPGAHAHRFRHTLATELLGAGATFEDVADILGNTPEVVRKHYAKWSASRQTRIDDLMGRVHVGANYFTEKVVIQ